MNKFQIQDLEYVFPYHHIPREVMSKGKTKIDSVCAHWEGEAYMCYMKHIAEIINSSSKESVLDIGCGDGKLFTMVNNDKHKVGVDLSYKASLFAKAFNPNAEIVCADVSTINKQFDIVTAIEVLEHIPDAELTYFLSEVYKHLTIDGKAYIQVPTVVIPIIPKHYRHYTYELFEKELLDSKVPLKIENVEWIMREDWIYKIYKKIMFNKYGFIQIGCVQRFMWKHVWNRLRIADSKTGTHMLVTLSK